MTQTKFTMEDALNVQQEQLRDYSRVLNDYAFNKLAEEVEMQNNGGYKSPNAVFRGSNMDNFIANLTMRLKRNEPTTKWTWARREDVPTLVNGDKEVRLGYLENVEFKTFSNIMLYLNDAPITHSVIFHLTKEASMVGMFESAFIGYYTERMEDGMSVEVESLEAPLIKHIGSMHKYVSRWELKYKG